MHLFQKKIATFLPLLLCISCSNGQSTTQSKAESEGFTKKLNAQHQFKVHGCAINYNGTDLYMSSGVEPWLKALGKNYRVVETTDPINRINLYIYDDIGIRLVERIADKQIDSFRFRLERPPHDIRQETDAEIEAELKKPNTEQVRAIFKDAIDVDGVLIGAYPMHDEVRTKFRSKTRVSYNYTAHCTDTQKGGSFGIELSTSYNAPEVIDHMFFDNHLDTMTEEQKKQLYRRKDETGQEVCDEYFDTIKMAVVPRYCTQEELDDEKQK